MLHRPLRLAAASLVALLLAGCQFTIQPLPFDPPIAGTVSAEDSTPPSPRARNVTVPAAETLYFRVNVPTALDLLYGEAVGSGLQVRWLTTTGATLAVSESPAFFVGSVSDLAIGAIEEEAVVEPLIIVNYACWGPCVAIAPTASTYVLAVSNRTSNPQTFDLFAYTFEANDRNDRGSSSNQTEGTAVAFDVDSEQEDGAIELVGDRDWYAYSGPTGRELVFSVNNTALGLRLRFEDGTIVAPGAAPINVFAGDRFEVYSAEGRAGPSETSGYTIQIRDP